MKFTLIIDKEKDEEVVATVHSRSALTEEIEALVLKYAGTDRIPAYREDDMKMLAFADMECVTKSKTEALNKKLQKQ